MKPEISIICLIYKSTKLMDAVYNSAIKYTPKLLTGEAEFLFVANDPTPVVVSHLIEKKYPFIISKNKQYTEEELFKMGYGIPEYINRVYKGYNQGILHAKGEKIVLINSDNFFSDNWLENLLKYYDFKRVVTSQLVERRHEKFGVFPAAIEKYFGDCFENYKDEEFNTFANSVKKEGLKEGGAYMPCLLSRDAAVYCGLYPGGNIAGESKKRIIRYGDECFYDKLATIGIKHYTALDSIVYHLKEGEREEDTKNDAEFEIDYDKYTVKEINTIPVKQYKKMFLPLLGNISADEILDRILFEINPFKKILKALEEIFELYIFSKEKRQEKRFITLFGFIRLSYKKKRKKASKI